MKTAVDITSKAAELVGGDRNRVHGDKMENLGRTAAMWSAQMSHKLKEPLTALDAANMMETLKIARRYSGTHNIDDYVDGAGYAGVAGEIAEIMQSTNRTPPPQSPPSETPQ